MPKQALVTVEQMSIRLGGVKVVSDLSFSIHHNEILGIVGESGSGKSVTAVTDFPLPDSPTIPKISL